MNRRPIVRIGSPGDGAVAVGRPKAAASPAHNGWRSWFPFGWWASKGPLNFRVIGNTEATFGWEPPDPLFLRQTIDHPEQGMRVDNFDGFSDSIAPAARWEDANHILTTWDATVAGGDPIWLFLDPGGRTGPTNESGIIHDWYNTAALVDPEDLAAAEAAAAPVIQGHLGTHASILAWRTADDVQWTVTPSPLAVVTLCRAIQNVDPHGRPCTTIVVDPDPPSVWSLWPPGELRLATSYWYPCGRNKDGTETAEGDLHRFGSAADFVDWIRFRFGGVPAGVPKWLTTQLHSTAAGNPPPAPGANNTILRYPHPREIRLMTWIAVGEGMKGIWWFTPDDHPSAGVWVGGASYSRRDTLAVLTEMGARLTPAIRARLLRAEKVLPEEFAASGGGTTHFPTPGVAGATLNQNYPNAYVATLRDQTDGTTYVVACNRDVVAEAVTLSSATHAGELVSLETGARTRLPATVSLGPLDGSIWRVDPDHGVPQVRSLDWNLSGKEHWAQQCWANPSSPAYRSRASVTTWPNEVYVGPGDDLQAAVDAAPDKTTFVLGDGGAWPRVELVGRSHLHFVAESPLGCTWAGMDYLGHEWARNYNAIVEGGVTSLGWVSLQLGQGTGAGTAAQQREAKDSWHRPPGDLIFRDIDFVSDGSPIYYRKFPVAPSGGWTTNHWYENAALAFRHVAGVLIEGCRFSGYAYGSDNSAGPPNDPQENLSGPSGHPGIVWGNAGIFNVCVRDNEFIHEINASNNGSCWDVFFDGARMVQTVGNTMRDKSHTGIVLHLTNDDYTLLNGEPVPSIDFGARHAHFNAVALNTFDVWGQIHVSFTGGQNYCGGNTWIVPAATYGSLVGFGGRCSRYHFLGHVYDCRFSCFEDNTVAGAGRNVTNVVTEDVWGGYQCGFSDPTYAYRGAVGRNLVQNNVVGGVVTRWVYDGFPETSAVPAEPTTATNNTDANGTRSGV